MNPFFRVPNREYLLKVLGNDKPSGSYLKFKAQCGCDFDYKKQLNLPKKNVVCKKHKLLIIEYTDQN